MNLIWIKRDDSFAQNAAAPLRKMLRREMLFEMRVAANAVARSAVERMKPFVAGGPRRQLLYQG